MSIDLLSSQLQALPGGMEAEPARAPVAEGSGAEDFDRVMERTVQAPRERPRARGEEADRREAPAEPAGGAGSRREAEREVDADRETARAGAAPGAERRERQAREEMEETEADGNILPPSVAAPPTVAEEPSEPGIRISAEEEKPASRFLRSGTVTAEGEAPRPVGGISERESAARVASLRPEPAQETDGPPQPAAEGAEPQIPSIRRPSAEARPGVQQPAVSPAAPATAEAEASAETAERLSRALRMAEKTASPAAGPSRPKEAAGPVAGLRASGAETAAESRAAQVDALRLREPATLDVAAGADGEEGILSASSEAAEAEDSSLQSLLQVLRARGEAGGAQGPAAAREGAARTEPLQVREGEIRATLGQEAWERSLARQVLESAGDGTTRLTLRLHPATLGSIEVRVSTDEGGARVQLHSQNAAVREAMEAALPRLREMFQGSGLQLVEASVARQGGFGGQPGGGHSGSMAGAGQGGEGTPDRRPPLHPEPAEEPGAAAAVSGGVSGASLLDYYV